MTMPTTQDEYLDLIDQVIHETDDLLLCAQDEGDADYQLSGMLPVYERLVEELKRLHAAVLAGEHDFADGADLPLMALAVKWKREIPFYDMLEALNQAHRRGV